MSRFNRCSVPGCGSFIAARDLMCRPHWAQVPYALRVKVAQARSAHARGELSRIDRDEVEARATATLTAGPAPVGAPPAKHVYAGVRITSGARLIACMVTSGGEPFTPRRSRQVRDHSEGFEWGYSGSGPSQLALALVLHATADPALTDECYQWFKWATVATWGPSWVTTAGEVRGWVERWKCEQDAHAFAPPTIVEGGGA